MNHRDGGCDGISVLSVDDDAQFLALVKAFLERGDEAIAVTTASDANEGLALLETNRFDCVISDYEMPEINGLEFLRAVRRGYECLPFILLTGEGSEEIASRAISAGATRYLQKGRITGRCTVLSECVRSVVRET